MFIRNFTKGKYLWMRNNVSTAISLLVDTTIVITLMTILGRIEYENMYLLIWNSYSWKLFFTIFTTPLFYIAVKLIRRLIHN